MTDTYGEAVVAAAARLAENPLFGLSTSGMELFHSNFLSWLISTHPLAARPVLAALGWPTQPYATPNRVRREHRHLDLFVTGPDGLRLIVENKVLAIPRDGQLQEYAQESIASGAVLTLLTLLPAPIATTGWNVVRYDDLIAPLQLAAAELRDHEDVYLVRQYRRLVELLIGVRDASVPEEWTAPWRFGAVAREEARRMRVLPLVEKMRALAMLAGFGDANRKSMHVDLTNTFALLEFAPPREGDRLGWQLQGDQFRLFVMTSSKKLAGASARTARESYVEHKYPDFFAFLGDPPSNAAEVLSPARNRKTWLGYSPTFVYQYRPLGPAASWLDVRQLLDDASLHVQAYCLQD